MKSNGAEAVYFTCAVHHGEEICRLFVGFSNA